MPEPQSRFIDLATRPLAGRAEEETLARGELMDRLAHSGSAAGDDDLETAVRELEKKAPAVLWKRVLAGAAGIVLAGLVLVPLLLLAWDEAERVGVSPGMYALAKPQKWQARLTQGMTPEKQVFLLRNTEIIYREDVSDWFRSRAKQLPVDPVDFEELLLEELSNGRLNLPEPFAYGRSIDPDNGLWALAEAKQYAWRLNSLRYSAKSRATIPSRPEYRKAVALFEEAAAAPVITGRLQDRNAERVKMLPVPRDLAELRDHHAFAWMQKDWGKLRSTVRMILQARAEDLEARKDTAGLRNLIRDWQQMTRADLHLPGERVSLVQSRFDIRSNAAILHRAAGALGLSEEQERLRKWREEWDRIGHTLGGGMHHDLRLRGSTSMADASDLAFMEEGDLKPGRLAEHAFADRLAVLAGGAVFLLLALCAWAAAWRRGGPVKRLAHGLMPLLRPGDYLWLGGTGLVLPAVWYLGLMRLSPAGCRDYSIVLGDAIPFMGRWGGVLLLSLCLLVQTARWRLAKRGGFIGLRPAALWPGWLVAALAALFIPLTGLIRSKPDLDEEYLACACAVLGIPLLWLLWRAAALVFAPRHAALGGVMLCRMLLPLFLAGCMAMAGLALLLKAEERSWVARDTISRPDPEGSGMSLIEARAEREFRRQLAEAMR